MGFVCRLARKNPLKYSSRLTNLPEKAARADPIGWFSNTRGKIGLLRSAAAVAGQIKEREVRFPNAKGQSMKQWQRNGLAGVLMAWGLSWVGLAGAGPYVNVMQPCDCPPNHYSSLHVLVPALWRWAAWCQGPCRYTFTRTLHPDVASTFYFKRYHCPSVNPLQFALQNYPGLAGIPPSSSFQSASQTGQGGQAAPPREVPPPTPQKLAAPEQLPQPREETDKK